MMRFMLCQDDKTQVGDSNLLNLWREKPGSWIWLDLYNEPADEEMNFLEKQFSLDKGAICEAQRDRHPPSFEAIKEYSYLLLKPLDAESNSLEFNTLQLAIFAGDRFLVTRHSRVSPYLEKLWQALEKEGCTDRSPFSMMADVCNRVVQRYGNVLLDLEQRLDIIEDELFDSPTDTLMKELVSYNTGLRKMNRILAYHVDVFNTLRLHLQKSNSTRHETFDDIYSRAERFYSLSALYQSVITDLIEAYISLNGHRLNQIMKVLTIVTVIFVPLTLLVGIYGMNFENMPELKSKHGYFILLSIMSGIAGILLYLFRRVRWL